MRRYLELLPWVDSAVVAVLSCLLVLAVVAVLPDIPALLGAAICGMGAWCIFVVASVRVRRARRPRG